MSLSPVQEIPTLAGSPVTSLTSDQDLGQIVIAGFGDGAIRVYDRRISGPAAIVRVYRDHKTWVQSVHLQRGGSRELVSARYVRLSPTLSSVADSVSS